MQRIGRVNRIGSPSTEIFIYNFFPTVQTDNEIELNKKAYMKLQAFHSALGEDSQIYSTSEEFESFGLFEKVPEEEKDERLEYLNFLRKFRDESPDLYKHIKNRIPQRARTGRKNKSTKGQTITFIKNKNRDCFYLIYPDLKWDELTFVEAARTFKAEIPERPIKIHDLHYDQINVALNSFHSEENVTKLGDKGNVLLGPNESKAINILVKNKENEFATDDEKDLLESARMAIRRGKFQKLPREIMQSWKVAQKTGVNRNVAFKNLITIVKSYPLFEFINEENEVQTIKPKPSIKTDIPQIILSESFST
jgi:hypothetical protein